jgi:hypothetical protein
MNPDLIVVANRWDGLGGRLHAILNAWSVARALGLEFRFVWQRNACTEFAESREIFDDAFVERFEIADSTCEARVILPIPRGLSLRDAKELCRAATTNSVIKINECFNVHAFANEPPETALARFRVGLSEIGWSHTLHALIESISVEKYPRGYSVIHVRAGDLVTGDWRQFVKVEKYMPMAYVEFAIETLSAPDRSPVVLVSDNEPYIRYLKTRFNLIRPADIVAGYADLTELQRAFADILVLSRARRIAGPRRSVFSQFAAHLGGLKSLSVDDLMTADDARRLLRDGIARGGKEAERSDVLRPVLARDICWFLDVFSDELAVGEQIILAQRAAKYEPDFCGALNRSAAALALAGNYKLSRKASLRALRAAALAADRHADPLFETLATSISAEVLALALGAPRHGRRRLSEWLGLASIVRHFKGGVDRRVSLDDIKRSLKRCKTLAPFQIHRGTVLKNLRFQIAALAWLTTANCRLSEITKTTIKSTDSEPLFLPSWRPSGFSKLQAAGNFPQAVRNLEVVTIRIARAIGTALSSASSHPPPFGNVDSITTSPSGLRWINGWAYNGDVGGTQLAVGYVYNDAVISGGVTFLARPDVAAALNDPRALNCGFAFPLPLAVQDKVCDLRSNIRIFDLEVDLEQQNLNR